LYINYLHATRMIKNEERGIKKRSFGTRSRYRKKIWKNKINCFFVNIIIHSTSMLSRKSKYKSQCYDYKSVEKNQRGTCQTRLCVYRSHKTVPSWTTFVYGFFNQFSNQFSLSKIISEIIICHASFQFPILNIFVTGPQLTNLLR